MWNSSTDLAIKMEENIKFEDTSQDSFGSDPTFNDSHSIKIEEVSFLADLNTNEQVTMADKKRSPNFTTDEVRVLRANITKQFELLYGKVTAKNTWQRKRAAWQGVLAAVNAVSPVPRTIAQIKKKFKDLKRKTRNKLAKQYHERQANGGGSEPHIDMDSVDEDMLTVIGKASIEGIPGGGFDSMQLSVPIVPTHTQHTRQQFTTIDYTQPSFSQTNTQNFNTLHNTGSFNILVIEEGTQTNSWATNKIKEGTKEQSTQTNFCSSIQEPHLCQGQQQLNLMERQTIAQERMVELFEQYLQHITNK